MTQYINNFIYYKEIIISIQAIIIIIAILKYYKMKKLYNLSTQTKKLFRKKEDIEIFKENKKILDEHLTVKFHHYFAVRILPLYKFGKKIEKKNITKAKEDFYADSLKTMPEDLKDYFQNIYGKSEFDVMILQYYFVNLNKFDSTHSNSFIKDNFEEKEYLDILNFAKPE